MPGAGSKLNTARVSLGEKDPFVAVVLFWVLGGFSFAGDGGHEI